jgi:hypothetical protein
MFDDILREVDIDIWPIKVSRGRFVHVQNNPYRLILEPRKLIIRHKHLFIMAEYPHAMTRDMSHLNR